MEDITTRVFKRRIGVRHPRRPEVLARLRGATEARIAVGRAGTRPRTGALLRFLADHARSKGSVFREVPAAWLEKRGLWSLQTAATDKNVYLTRPDLGRRIPDAGLAELKKRYPTPAQVQIVISDGLSCDAVLADYDEIVPPLRHGLELSGFSVGRPFFLHYGRVKAEDVIGEAVRAEVLLLLIGERPGLGQSESLSCYAVYHPTAATTEPERTVVSNIHREGLPPVEAAAVIVELVQNMMRYRASGIPLSKRLAEAGR